MTYVGGYHPPTGTVAAGSTPNRGNQRTERRAAGYRDTSLTAEKKASTATTMANQRHQPMHFPFLGNNCFPWSSALAGASSSTTGECALPPDTADNFSRYSKFLVKNSNGVDGMGLNIDSGKDESILWVDNLGDDICLGTQHDFDDDDGTAKHALRPFSLLSWNILAQTLYESQYQRRRIAEVALSSPNMVPHQRKLDSLSSSPHPHPWSMRSKRIIEIMSHSNADIVCLQECELHSFTKDLVPALSKLGYDGVAQEDDRPDKPTPINDVTKHRYSRNHIVSTFWRREKFEPVGGAMARSRTLTTVLRLKSDSTGGVNDKQVKGGSGADKMAMPTVAVVNVHLEGHPKRYSERTRQLQYAMNDLEKRIENERKDTTAVPPDSRIEKLNALVLAGDFNCELHSSACSNYLRMGRLGKQAGLGGIHGEDSLALPPSLLETTEATQVIQPIMEWGVALPEEKFSNIEPHPFRRNGMTSAYPAWLGREDARDHFTFCSELTKRPVPGLDQIWFSSMTLERVGLRKMFNDCDTGLWERYFYSEEEVQERMEIERKSVLQSGLPSLDCRYPSDHLPIGAIFEWKSNDCTESCLLDDDAKCEDEGEVRGLNVVNSEGNDVQDDALQEQLNQMQDKLRIQSFDNPHDELQYLLSCCPWDSEHQKSDVEYVLSSIEPPLSLTVKERPSPIQFEQLEARRSKKAQLLETASLGVRTWLKNIWKADKRVGKWERENAVRKARLEEKEPSISSSQ